MKQETKQAIFDVLDEGKMLFKFGIQKDNYAIVYQEVPDNIETKMLDWLEKQHCHYFICGMLKKIAIYADDSPYYRWGEGYNSTRQLDIARICVWVHQQQEESV